MPDKTAPAKSVTFCASFFKMCPSLARPRWSAVIVVSARAHALLTKVPQGTQLWKEPHSNPAALRSEEILRVCLTFFQKSFIGRAHKKEEKALLQLCGALVLASTWVQLPM